MIKDAGAYLLFSMLAKTNSGSDEPSLLFFYIILHFDSSINMGNHHT